MDQPAPRGSLLKWWTAFKQSHNKPQQQQQQPSSSSSSRSKQPLHPPYVPPGRGLEKGSDGTHRVFGVRLEDSLQFASVAISMLSPSDGKQYVYGYVPIVVAKCGMWLKENATQTEGIFRVSGSNKRINQLQAVFDEPPRYGKDFDWTGYSVHDAASVLRRYLNSLPDPVIPAGLYLDFTAVLQRQQPMADSIAAYRELIALLPPASRYLLLYLLDFLSVFARCSAQNLMTASNLAVVFQPGLVSPRGPGQNALLGFPGFVEGRPPPSGSAAQGAEEQAGEHGRGKEVLEFLIENQAAFMLDLEPPVDEERQRTKGVSAPSPPLSQSAPPSSQPPPMPLMQPQAQPVASTSAVPFDPTVGGTNLARRGSEKSVERRRLRKSHDTKDGGKVKRSKTWGSSTRRKRGEGRDGSPSPSVTPSSSSPQPPFVTALSTPSGQPTLAPPVSAPRSPMLSHQPSLKKPRKSADAALSSSLPSTSSSPSPTPTPVVHAPTPAPIPAPTPTSAPATDPPSTSSGAGGGGGGGGGKSGGLLGFARSKRRSLTPEGGGR